MKARPTVLEFGMGGVRAASGGLSVPGADTMIVCAAITVSVEYPEEPSR